MSEKGKAPGGTGADSGNAAGVSVYPHDTTIAPGGQGKGRDLRRRAAEALLGGPVLTPREAGGIAGLPVAEIRLLCWEGAFRHVKEGGRLFILARDFRDWLFERLQDAWEERYG